jgi:hypothetical protein
MALRTPTLALTAALAAASDEAVAALDSASVKLLSRRSRCYFSMLAGNAVTERVNSYTEIEKWVETNKLYKYFQNNGDLPTVCDLLKINDTPDDVEWDEIKKKNLTWVDAKSDNVSYRL